MKNKKAKKTYPSTKKKTSNSKIAVTMLLVIVLLAGAIVGTIAAISDGFTKPVEDWFSDKATVTTPGDDQGDQTTPGGNDQDDQTGDEVVACEHVFEYGVCTKCGVFSTNLMKYATKAISADEDCIVNYYDDHLNLIKSETVKGGDKFIGIEGYSDYVALVPAELTVPNLDNAKDDDILVNGEFFTKDSNLSSTFLDLYPMYSKVDSVFCLPIGATSFFGKYNDNPVWFFGDYDELISYRGGTIGVQLKAGDNFNIVAGGDNGSTFDCYIDNSVMYIHYDFTDFSYGIDVVNLIVIGYDSEVA